MLLKEVPFVINIATDRLWEAYSAEDRLADVKAHLVKEGWLSRQGGWVDVESGEFKSWKKGRKEPECFEFFSSLFNTVLAKLRMTSTTVSKMVHAGPIGLESTRTNAGRPDTFLQMAGFRRQTNPHGENLPVPWSINLVMAHPRT